MERTVNFSGKGDIFVYLFFIHILHVKRRQFLNMKEAKNK